MTNPFETLNEKMDRIEKLFIEFKETIIKKESESKVQSKPALVKIEEAEKITGYKKGYIYELVCKNAIPYIRIGRSIRFDLDELNEWMRSGRPNILNRTIKSLKK